MKEFEFFIDKNFSKRSLDIYGYAKKENGQVFKIEPMNIVLSTVEIGEKVDPCISVGYMDADAFLNALSNALIKSGYKDNSTSKDGEIKRIEEHLKDMREITFKFINGENK